MRVLVWFRADLRVHDNSALAEACRIATAGVVGVFTICPRQWLEHDWSDVKVDFILRNLRGLSTALRALNIPLLIRAAPTFSDVPSVLTRLADEQRCDALFFNREYEVNERRRDAASTAAFDRSARTVRTFHDQVILPPAAVQTGQDTFYSVFTPYKRAWIAQALVSSSVAPRPSPRRQSELACEPDVIPSEIEGFDLSTTRADLWPEGEAIAQRRLAQFIKVRIERYDTARDFPAQPGTSQLSPYLAAGVISPRLCLHAAREANASELSEGRSGPTVWISELVWREFYRHVLVGFPHVSMHRPFKLDTDGIPWRDNEDDLTRWCEGRTGYPIVDAGMRQLVATGWMHNRLRMVVAMFLTKDLLLDWRRGEQFFMRHLIDGDLASNNGGWQWSASTGTDAAPYSRIFNPFRQSVRFDPDGTFIRTWVPELRSVPTPALHDPKELASHRLLAPDYPELMVDHVAARQRAIETFRRHARVAN